MEILCGNTKLMNRFEIFRGHEDIERNIQYLEGEGKTVVALAVNQVPQLIIALEEAHLAKPEAREVIEYLQTVMNLRVCMITGDNKQSALRVARHLNIPFENVTYQAYPDTKRSEVQKY